MHSNHQKLIKAKLVQVDSDERLAGSEERQDERKDEQSVRYGKFHIEPLELGFGTIVGNALRRTLLSSLQGAAITSIRVKGALHEFSAIPGVTEDLADIILNLKGVRLKLHSSQATIHFQQRGAGIVTAGSIITGHSVEVMNPDHYIATCGEDADFEVEMKAKTGKGFVLADRNREEKAPVNTIWLDANFSPIRKVNFSVSESSSVTGSTPGYDKLSLEIWTDGSVKPVDAVAYGARILQDQLEIFAGFDLNCELIVDEPVIDEEALNANLYRRLSEFELSVRASNCIVKSGLKFVGELAAMKKADVQRLQNTGKRTIEEMEEILVSLGLGFGMDLGNFPDPEKMEELGLVSDIDDND